jgi:hypothetical protein
MREPGSGFWLLLLHAIQAQHALKTSELTAFAESGNHQEYPKSGEINQLLVPGKRIEE